MVKTLIFSPHQVFLNWTGLSPLLKWMGQNQVTEKWRQGTGMKMNQKKKKIKKKSSHLLKRWILMQSHHIHGWRAAEPVKTVNMEEWRDVWLLLRKQNRSDWPQPWWTDKNWTVCIGHWFLTSEMFHESIEMGLFQFFMYFCNNCAHIYSTRKPGKSLLLS